MGGEAAEGDAAGGDAAGEAAEGGKGEGEEGEKKADDAAADMGAMMGKMQLVALDNFEGIDGFAEIPKLFLALMISYPVFGDAVKAATMAYDLGGDKAAYNFGSIAALVGAYGKAQLAEAAEEEAFGAAWLTSDDMDELKEVADQKDVKALVFPGIVGAWTDQGDALGQAPKADGKTQVLFKFKGKAFKPAGDKLKVFCRQFAKVESLEAPAGDAKYSVCTLSDYTTHVFENVEAWKKACDTVGAVVADAKGEGAADDKKENDDKKEEDDKNMAEGAGMAE